MSDNRPIGTNEVTLLLLPIKIWVPVSVRNARKAKQGQLLSTSTDPRVLSQYE